MPHRKSEMTNKDTEDFSSDEDVKTLVNWLVDVKNFNRKIWEKRLIGAGILPED